MILKKKPTTLMLQQLQKFQQNDIVYKKCTPDDFPITLKGLLNRGIVEVKKEIENGRIMMVVTLTQKGEEMIQSLS